MIILTINNALLGSISSSQPSLESGMMSQSKYFEVCFARSWVQCFLFSVSRVSFLLLFRWDRVARDSATSRVLHELRPVLLRAGCRFNCTVRPHTQNSSETGAEPATTRTAFRGHHNRRRQHQSWQRQQVNLLSNHIYGSSTATSGS